MLRVIGIDKDMLTLQAGKPGVAHITAKDATSKDSIDLHVSAIASSQPYVPEDISHGFAMLPGSDVRFDFFHFDAAGKLLTGSGAEQSSATPASALEPRSNSDGFDLVGPSASSTTIALHAGKHDYGVPVVDPKSVASIELVETAYSDNPDEHEKALPHTFTVPYPGAPTAGRYGVAAYLADGRYLFGACADLGVKVTSGPDNILSRNPWARGFNLRPPPAGDRSRDLVLGYDQPGTVTFAVTCFGKTASYTANVVPTKKQP